MELVAWRDYAKGLPLAYWRTASQLEVDFILGEAEVAVEVKATRMAANHDLRGLRAFNEEFRPKRAILVSTDPKPRRTDDGIEILPIADFLSELWAGKLC